MTAPSAPERATHTLPIGTRMDDYVINGLIGEGGFGIVYLAQDTALQRRVAIKEYLPSSIASRSTASPAVLLKSQQHTDTFKAGLKSFLNEARLLARFDHPALVKVYRFWEANGTAYMAMPFYEGPTLRHALAARTEPMDEAQLREWLGPLLDALGVMHASNCYHRDVAPDNILLTANGPLLLDLGAARQVIGDLTHALTAVLKPGYAPIEQYGEADSMSQGPWTDLYAIGAVVYAAVTGRPPMSSIDRMMGDRLRPLGTIVGDRFSAPFLAAIDAALAVRPTDRPRDIASFRRMLDGLETPPVPTPMQQWGPTSTPPPAKPATRGDATTLAIHAAREMELPTDDRTVRVPRSAPARSPATAAARTPSSTSSRTPRIALLALLGLLVVGAAAYFLGRHRAAPEVATQVPPPVEATASAAAAVPVSAAPSATLPAQEAAQVPAATTLAPAAAPLAAPASTTTTAARNRRPLAIREASASVPVTRAAAVPEPGAPIVVVPAPVANPYATVERNAAVPSAFDSARPSPARGARTPPADWCGDMLQKASQQQLTPLERAAYVRNCR